MESKIVRFSDLGHPDFILHYDSAVLSEDIDWFISYLEESVSDGTKFKPEETFKVGWMITKIKSVDKNHLSICEPDFKSFPIHYVDSITKTLTHLRLQKDVTESIGMTPIFADIRESALVCNSLNAAAGFLLEREEPSGRDSGWFIGCIVENHDHLDEQNISRKSLYEISLKHQAVIPFLALPVGISMVQTEEGSIESITYFGKELEFKKGSLLYDTQRERKKLI